MKKYNLYCLKKDLDLEELENEIKIIQNNNLDLLKQKVEEVNELQKGLYYFNKYKYKEQLIEEIKTYVIVNDVIDRFIFNYNYKQKNIIFSISDNKVFNILKNVIFKFFDECIETEINSEEVLNVDEFIEEPTRIEATLNFLKNYCVDEVLELIYITEFCWGLREGKEVYIDNIEPFNYLCEILQKYEVVDIKQSGIIGSYKVTQKCFSIKEFSEIMDKKTYDENLIQVDRYYQFNSNFVYLYDQDKATYVNGKGLCFAKETFADSEKYLKIGDYFIDIKNLSEEFFDLSPEETGELFQVSEDFIFIAYMLLADITKKQMSYAIDRQIKGYKYIKFNIPHREYSKYKLSIKNKV